MNDFSELQALVQAESLYQQQTLSLIASENYASKAVLEISGSMLTNKYAEGYPGKRYYQGNMHIDKIEEFAKLQAQQAFHTDFHVNVQPYSGSPMNLAVYSALLQPGDTILALSLAHGGHLTHGHSVSFPSKIYNFVHYGVSEETGLIEYDEVLRLAKEHRPKLIVCGATAYPMMIDFARFNRIAREAGCFLMADVSHIAGLIVGGVHTSPFEYVDVVTTTTHKSLRGPRGGLIFCRPEFAKAIDKAVFPGLQGGPHMHTIAAKAQALIEAQQPAFQQYAAQIVANAKALAYALQQRGMRLVADGTDTHLMLVDLRGTGVNGKEAATRLEEVGIMTNMNSIPFDSQPPTNPSGLRLGTPAVTTRGMREREMETLADIITGVITSEITIQDATDSVTKLTKKFRIPGY